LFTTDTESPLHEEKKRMIISLCGRFPLHLEEEGGWNAPSEIPSHRERKKGGDEPPLCSLSLREEGGWIEIPSTSFPLTTRGRRVNKTPHDILHRERKDFSH
jgi:hypothetical protein